MKKSMSAMFIVAALALTSACGGDDGNRPSKAEVKKSITSGDSVFGKGIPKTAIDCVSGVLADSKISDKTLTAIVEGDEDYKGSDKEKKSLEGLQTKLSECAAK